MPFQHNFSPILFEIGPLDIRWYGLMYAVCIASVYSVWQWLFKREGKDVALVDSLALYLFVGLVVGARLGHVFFYEAEYFLSNPGEIVKIWKGGLASHGGAIGIFVALWVWTGVKRLSLREYIGLICVPLGLGAGFVRIGNFMNSEIVGYATGSDYGVVFERLGEDFARHPVQLYSTLMNWVVFGVMLFAYKRYYKRMPKEFLAFLYVGLYFLGRFVVEFWKDLKGPVAESSLNMGQLLSVLPILISLGYFLFLGFGKKKPGKNG